MSAHPRVDVDDDAKLQDGDSPPNSPGAVHIPPSSVPSSPINLSVVHQPWGGWSQMDYRHDAFIRGPTYLSSKHKIVARAPWLECVDLEVVVSKSRQENTAARSGSPLQRITASHPVPAGLTAVNPTDPSFTLVLNFQVPLKHEDGVYVVMYFKHRQHNLQYLTAPPLQRTSQPLNEQKVQLNPSGEYADAALEAAAKSAFLEALKRFMAGSKEYRDSHLKFIPHLIEGPWVAKKAVGTKPAVIGTKLKLSYHTNPQLNYLEVDIDVCSSKIAANIFSVVKKGCEGAGHRSELHHRGSGPANVARGSPRRRPNHPHRRVQGSASVIRRPPLSNGRRTGYAGQAWGRRSRYITVDRTAQSRGSSSTTCSLSSSSSSEWRTCSAARFCSSTSASLRRFSSSFRCSSSRLRCSSCTLLSRLSASHRCCCCLPSAAFSCARTDVRCALSQWWNSNISRSIKCSSPASTSECSGGPKSTANSSSNVPLTILHATSTTPQRVRREG